MRIPLNPPQKHDLRAQGNAGVQYRDIDAEAAGRRLDNFLLGELKGVPRSHVYRLIRSGQVRINSGRTAPSYRLRAGDRVGYVYDGFSGEQRADRTSRADDVHTKPPRGGITPTAPALRLAGSPTSCGPPSPARPGCSISRMRHSEDRVPLWHARIPWLAR
ncbi:MAG: hypothetical protein HC868_08155 [Sphingomonadales bacterium]|nr:hypothetical protein [Sphingomonadales bacterium]